MQNTFPEQSLLEKAENGDLESLIELDRRGFILGASENPQEFVKRLKTFQENSTKMETALAKDGKYELEGVSMNADDRIPQKIFEEASGICRNLYGFCINWVPGFFIDPFFLFGGCAFSFYPDFFALFIIRRNFRYSKQWFIYKRQELLAHELCHIARIGLESESFEETFAYQTATSPLRRLLGGLFLKPFDSYLMLAAAFALLAAQFLRVYLFPALPISAFWGFLVLVIAWLSLRYTMLMRTLNKARNAMKLIWGNGATKALFRSTDKEIRTWATFKNAGDAQKWLESQGIRWKIIDTIAKSQE